MTEQSTLPVPLRWFRFYIEALYDPKVQLLSRAQHLRDQVRRRPKRRISLRQIRSSLNCCELPPTARRL
jgi:hypothetical protein